MHPTPNLTAPAAWANAVGTIGAALIWVAIVSFVASLIVFATPLRQRIAKVGTGLFVLGASSAWLTFGCLATLMLRHQFQYSYVFKHSDSATPLGYLVSAIWAGQEGSFLLWTCMASLVGVLALRGLKHYRPGFVGFYSLFLAGLCAILAYESPFKQDLLEGRFMPPEGRGLNPTLFNYWILIHPPTIFLGFGALTVLSAYGFAAMVHRDRTSWVAQVRPWTILTATLTGIGLIMGGFWAYETLGWGGFWAWDPVENTSFVPWLWAVALLHGLYVQTTRGKWQSLNIFLAGTSLLTFVYGTFLTRSGFLKDQSVHSFAEMNRNALWILLGILGTLVGSFLVLFGRDVWLNRKSLPEAPREAKGLHRENFIATAILLMIGFALAAGIGMSIPLFQSMRGLEAKVVEESVYHNVLVWLFVPFALAAALGPIVSWRGMGFRQVLGRLSTHLAVSLTLLGLIMLWLQRGVPNLMKPEPSERIAFPLGLSVPTVPWVLFLAWLCLFAISVNLSLAAGIWKRSKLGIGGFLTHAGVFLTLCGLIVSRGLERKEEAVVQAGRPGFALGYVISLKERNRNFLQRENTVEFEFQGLGEKPFTARPVLYYTLDPNKPEPTPVVRPDVRFRGLSDLYIAIYPMAFEAADPTTLKKGQSTTIDGTTYTFRGIRREGEAGVMGTQFFADVQFQNEKESGTVSPGMEIGQGEIKRATADTSTMTVSLQKIDAATGNATFEFFYKSALYPLDVYYKPLSILVWIGAGIMTLGGFIAAYDRRNRRAPKSSKTTYSEWVDPEPEKENATLTTA